MRGREDLRREDRLIEDDYCVIRSFSPSCVRPEHRERAVREYRTKPRKKREKEKRRRKNELSFSSSLSTDDSR